MSVERFLIIEEAGKVSKSARQIVALHFRLGRREQMQSEQDIKSFWFSFVMLWNGSLFTEANESHALLLQSRNFLQMRAIDPEDEAFGKICFFICHGNEFFKYVHKCRTGSIKRIMIAFQSRVEEACRCIITWLLQKA